MPKLLLSPLNIHLRRVQFIIGEVAICPCKTDDKSCDSNVQISFNPFITIMPLSVNANSPVTPSSLFL